MSENILEPTINGLPPVTDWQKVFLALQQANEAFLRGATLPELGKQIIGDVQIQGADFVDLPVAEDSTPVALPIPETGNKFGFLADGKFTQPTGGTLEYSATQWGLTLFDGSKWVKKFTLELPRQTGVDIINPTGEDLPKEKAVAIYAAKKDDFESVLNQLPLQEVKKVNDTISQTYESGYYVSSAGVKTKSTDSNRRLYSIDVLPGDIVYANSINHTTPNYVTVDVNGSVLAVGPTGTTSNPSKFELILKVNLESKVYINTNGLSEIFVVRNKVNASGESNKVYTPNGSIITREGWAYLEIDVDREDTILYNVYNKSTTTVIFFGNDGTVETIVPLLGSTLVNRYGRYNVQKSGKVIANYFLGNDSYMLKIGKKDQLITYSPFLRAADIQGVSESNWNEGSVFFDKNIDSNGNYLNTPKGCVLRKRLIAGEIVSYSILNTNTPAAIFVSDNNVISNVSNDVGEISAEYIATENGYLYANHIDVLHPYKMTSLGGKLTKGKLISSTGVITDNAAYNLVEIPFVIGDIVTINGKKPSDTNPAIVLKIGTAYSLLNLTDNFFVKYTATAVGSLFVNTTDYASLKIRKANTAKVIVNNDFANIGDNQYFIWFEDNFNGNSLDKNKWKYRLGEKSKGNNLSRNVVVADGKLKIILKEEASFIENENGVTDIPSTKAFTCGGIDTILSSV
ncbi:hypothetical protein [Sphingobacterium siyangense]|uniref:hypothetical protein n=1 Tax=Sphingobacterium siyangense TaxID=459529 RepID=UPI003DA2B1D4